MVDKKSGERFSHEEFFSEVCKLQVIEPFSWQESILNWIKSSELRSFGFDPGKSLSFVY